MSAERNTALNHDDIERDLEAIERDEAHLDRDVDRLEHDLDEQRQSQQVEVVVNTRPVRLLRRHETGLQIKRSAIEQGVPIDFGFQLWQEFPDGTERQIGDHDEVTVHPGTMFSAVAPDDNS